jgi:hypothetical protein
LQGFTAFKTLSGLRLGLPRTRAILLALTLSSITLGLALFATGGFVAMWLGMRVSARSPTPAMALALACLAAWWTAAQRARAVTTDLEAIDSWMHRHSRGLVLAVAAVATTAATAFGTYSAAGADASGYLSQAAMLSSGRLERVEPLAGTADWPDAALSLAPLGWWPAARSPTEQAPTYPVGLPLLMAPLHAVGGTAAACLVIPFALLIAVTAAGAIADRVGGPMAAIAAAVALATSPVTFVQAIQPMGDVPVTAAWLCCWWWVLSDRPLAAGWAAGVAVLIRPNLAPLAAIPAAYLLLVSARYSETVSRISSAVRFSIPVAIAVACVAGLYWRWFGSPLRSGYGAPSEIFTLGNAGPSALLYGQWSIEARAAWLLAAPLALIGALCPPQGRRPLRWLMLFAALVVAAYLVYNLYDVWTYLRFMLPAIALAGVAVAAVAAGLVGRTPRACRAPLLVMTLLGLAAVQVHATRTLEVVRTSTRHARASAIGTRLADRTTIDSVVVAGEQSGAVRYYTNRSVLRWDILSAAAWPQAMARLEASRRDVWIVLDEWEEEPFRRKLSGTPASALDWPPALDAGSEIRTRAWRVSDRERYLRGESIVTDRVAASRD